MLNLDGYPMGLLQDMLALLAEAGEMTAAEVRSELERHVREVAAGYAERGSVERQPPRRRRRRPGLLPCNQEGCDGHVNLYRVNVSKCTNIGGPWQTQAICDRCGHERLSALSTAEIIRAGRIE